MRYSRSGLRISILVVGTDEFDQFCDNRIRNLFLFQLFENSNGAAAGWLRVKGVAAVGGTDGCHPFRLIAQQVLGTKDAAIVLIELCDAGRHGATIKGGPPRLQSL
jgi:hypothetical protein